MSDPVTIGRYEVRGRIGEGGMGTLFLAWDPRLERLIAIKTLTHDDADFRERFAREARAAAKLRHPNIVTIYDVGEGDGRPYIAMEYCQGENLEKLLRGPSDLGIERKLSLLEQLCDGLAFAHRAGIVHRDIKPANLMVNAEGQLKVLDFGIARFAQSDGLTQAGSLIGTLNYMSPEQLQGKPVDHRSDIFSVGLVAYELLSGRQAFPGQLTSGLLHRVLHEEPPTLVPFLPGPLVELARIVARAMAKDPRDRYQDLGDLRRELMGLQSRQIAAAWERTERMPVPEATVVEVASPPANTRASGGTAAARRFRSLAWFVRAAVLLALAGLALIWLARVADQEEVPVEPRGALTEDRAGQVAAPPVASPTGPNSEGVATGANPRGTAGGPPSEAGPPVNRPEAPRSVPSDEPGAVAMPAVCARLLERVSLGETLSEAEQRTLASKCRS